MKPWIATNRIAFKLVVLIILKIGICLIDRKFVFAQSPVLLPGFPLVLDSISGSGFAPLVTDFDNDNLKEIFLCYKLSADVSKIIILREDGSVMLNWPKLIYDTEIVSAAGDMNNDGYIDIVLRSMDSLYVLDREGTNFPGFPVYFPSGPAKSLALYDLDNDGIPEIITTGYNKVAAFKSNGDIVNGWPVFLPGNFSDRVYPSPITVSDIDGDNLPEVIVPSSYCPASGCDNNTISIFNADGSPHSISPIISDSGYYFAYAPVTFINDITGVRLLVNSTIERNDIITTRTRSYNRSGILERAYFTTNYINSSGPISVANPMRGTGQFTLSFGYQNNPSYHMDNILTVLPGWPVNANSHYIRSINMFGVNTESLLMTAENFADTSGGFKETYGYIKIFNEFGIQVNWSPIRSRGIPVSAPVICDINNDGTVDIVTINEFYHSTLQVGKILYVWTLPWLQYNPAKLYWPMYAHDRYRTNQYGFIPPDEPVGIQPVSNILPEKFELHQNYPNPFNPSTTIKFDIRSSGNVSLKVYDVLGREVAVLADEYLRAGSYERVFESSDLSSGVYFYTLRADEFEKTLRMVVVR